MADNKYQAIVDFLLTCPQFNNTPLYFNFIEAKDNNKQIVTTANDKALNDSYIDGSVLKRFTFTIIDYKSITYQAIPKLAELSNENIEEIMDVQSIIDWVTEQAKNKNFPDFGTNCIIEEMKATTDNPDLNGVDTTLTAPLAKYSMVIQITYLDKSEVIWTS